MSTLNVQNFFSRLIFLVGAVVFSAVFFVVGATAFLIFLGLAIFAFLAMSVRVWWLRRKIAKTFPHDAQGRPDIEMFLRTWQRQASGQASENKEQGRIIEGEIIDSDEEH